MSEERSVSRRGFLRVAAAGTAAAGASSTAAAQEGEGGGGGGGTVTVDVVNYAYEPGTEEPLVIPPGTTVEWVWESGGHNVHVDSQPEGADWSGHEPLEDAGFTYSHTFQTTGEYHYYCTPHESLGMVADIRVEEGATLPGQGGGGGGGPVVPDSAKSLGLATTVAMAAILGLAWAFLKYGGGGAEPAE